MAPESGHKEMIQRSRQVKAFALELGFDAVGITSAEPAFDAEQHHLEWVGRGCAVSMNYLGREYPRRGHPRDLLPEANSVICLAMNYNPADGVTSPGEPAGLISRYARGRDYHRVIKKKLRRMEEFLGQLDSGEVSTRSCVDSAPLLERALARRAGLGVIGWNTCLIHPKLGSWLFLAEVLTSLELALDTPAEGSCEQCGKCLEVCPTGALVEPFLLDARKCLSYWTVEHKGEILPEVQPAVGRQLFGCDLCQEVCPHNREAPTTREPAFQENLLPDEQPLAPLLALKDDEDFLSLFQGSSLLRAKREGIIRNALLVAMNTGAVSLLPQITRMAKSGSSEQLRQLARKVQSALESGDASIASRPK